MRIGFDVSQTAEEKAGCGFVADQLIRHLARIDKKSEYLLYPTFYSYRHPSCSRVTRPDAANIRVHFAGMSFHDMVSGWEKKVEDRTGWLGSPDIVQSNNFSCVKDHKAKIVYVIYDLTPLVHPEYSTEENRLVCFDGLLNASLYADHCLAISEYSKKTFLEYFPHYPEERISVILLGTRPTIHQIKDSGLIKKVLRKFSIRGEYWLGVGTIEPRKNYRLLIEALNDIDDGRKLVIAGGRGWLESDLGGRVRELGMQDRVSFTGYVTDEELSALYSACFAFVYPSFYEGFGLPVLEAMSCGAAVISSDTSSLPEVGGDAVLYIDPASKESLIGQMRQLNGSPALLRSLRGKALERSRQFSWHRAAETVLRVYEKTLGTKPWCEEQ